MVLQNSKFWNVVSKRCILMMLVDLDFSIFIWTINLMMRKSVKTGSLTTAISISRMKSHFSLSFPLLSLKLYQTILIFQQNSWHLVKGGASLWNYRNPSISTNHVDQNSTPTSQKNFLILEIDWSVQVMSYEFYLAIV